MQNSEIPIRLADTAYNGLIGVFVEPSDDGQFLIQSEVKSSASSPIAILDTTFFPENQFTGHKPGYKVLIPGEFLELYVPTVSAVLEGQFIRKVVDQTNIVLFQGGEDPGPLFQQQNPKTGLTDLYGGYNPLRDQVDLKLLKETKSHEHEIFILGICRGLEIMGNPLVEAVPHHRPADSSSDMTTHRIVQTRDIPIQIPLEIRDFTIPSNHHLQVQTITKELSDQGWQEYYSDPLDNGIEIMIRVDQQGIVTGILFQGHPERYPESDPTGREIINWIQKCIRFHHQQYSAR